MKTLRLDRNNLTLDILPVGLLKDSNLSLLSYDGNRFDERAFQGKEGYDQVDIDSNRENQNIISFLGIFLLVYATFYSQSTKIGINHLSSLFETIFIRLYISFFSDCFIKYTVQARKIFPRRNPLNCKCEQNDTIVSVCMNIYF